MKRYVIDIETMPDESVIHLLPEPKISSVLKDPEKIAKAKEVAKKEQISQMGISPLWGQIASIGIYDIDEKKKIFLSGDEEEILKKIIPVLKKFPQIITYNGKGFDIPFIFKRALKYKLCRLDMMKIYTNKYDSEKHIDIMAEFCDWGKFEKLDILAKIYLGASKVDFDVTTIKDLVKTPEGLKKLEEYNMQDVMITYELAKLMYDLGE